MIKLAPSSVMCVGLIVTVGCTQDRDAVRRGGVVNATPHTSHVEGLDAAGYAIGVDGSKSYDYGVLIQKNDGPGVNIVEVYGMNEEKPTTARANVRLGDPEPRFELSDGEQRFFCCCFHIQGDGSLVVLPGVSASIAPGGSQDYVNLLFSNGGSIGCHVHFDRSIAPVLT